MELKLKAGEFYGTTSQSLSARGFRFTEKAYTSRARLPTHAHELSHFCFVLAGNYNETIGRRLFERRRMALVYRQFEHGTVGDYIRKARINYARRRMLESNEPLVEIALAAGFADQTHFTRSFKRVTGMTPTEFRRLIGRR